MTTYKEIYGTNVEVLASDPTNPVEGQIWYNSTSQTLKGYALVAGSWATAGPLNTAREQLAGAGIQTASLAFGGLTPTVTAATESYNGTSWTSVNSLNTARKYISGCGTQTAALGFGGGTPTSTGATELWNGTAWSNLPSMGSGGYGTSGCGTQAAALGFGKTPGTTTTEEWTTEIATAGSKTLTVS